jgi:hypothetical protein
MRRLAIVEGIEAAAQRLAVDGHARRHGLVRLGVVRLLGRVRRQAGRMLAEHPFDFRPLKTAQDEPHRRVGWGLSHRDSEPAVQAAQMDADEGVDLTIRDRPGQHRQHCVQQDRSLGIHLPLATAWIGDLRKQ